MIRSNKQAVQNRRVVLGLTLVFAAIVPHRYLILPEFQSLFQPVFPLLFRFLPVVVIFALAAEWILREGVHSVLRGAASSPAAIWLACLLLSGILSVWNAPNPAFSLARTLYYFLPGILCYFVFLRFGGDEHGVKWLVTVVFCAGAVIGLYGIAEFFAGKNFLFRETFSVQNPLYRQFAHTGYVWRISATIGHPVYTGTFLMMCLPFGFFHYVSAGSWKGKTLSALGTSAVTVALFLTFTRGAWIGALVSLFFFLRRRPEVYKLLILIVLLGSIVVFARPNRTFQVLKSRNPWEDVGKLQGFGFRLMSYKHSSVAIERHPLFGIGSGNYRYLPLSHGEKSDTPDNMYLRVQAENGLFGLASLVGVLVVILRNSLAGSRRKGIPGVLSSAFCASFIGFYIDLLTCDALYFPLTRMTFWGLAGLEMGLSSPEREETEEIV